MTLDFSNVRMVSISGTSGLGIASYLPDSLT